MSIHDELQSLWNIYAAAYRAGDAAACAANTPSCWRRLT
jgi:hypothetical protein